MKTITFKDPKDNSKWENFEKEVVKLAKDHNIKMVFDDLKSPVLVTLEWPVSRNFNGLTEQFVTDQDLWEKAKPILKGNEIYFGEIAGKHSEIYGTLNDNEVKEENGLDLIKNWMNKNGKHKREKYSFVFTLLENMKENFNDKSNTIREQEIKTLEELVKNLE